MIVHRARGFTDAEQWDLEFWQSQTPETRLSALVEIHRDVEQTVASRTERAQNQKDED